MELRTLQKGASFVPTTHTNSLELNISFFKLMRKLRLRYHFEKVIPEQVKPTDDQLKGLRTRSEYMPPSSHKSLDTFEKLVKQDLSKIKFQHKPKRYTLTEKEFGILKAIANNPSITCQKADKGGALVILDTEHYNKEMISHLNDVNTYGKLENDPTKEFMETLRTIINKAHDQGTINERTRNFLIQKYPRSPTIYIIPKIHKYLRNPPFRPIVNTRGSLHEPIGQYLDRYLQSSVEKMRTFIKDTTDFF